VGTAPPVVAGVPVVPPVEAIGPQATEREAASRAASCTIGWDIGVSMSLTVTM
jgi:hypothetical protein